MVLKVLNVPNRLRLGGVGGHINPGESLVIGPPVGVQYLEAGRNVTAGDCRLDLRPGLGVHARQVGLEREEVKVDKGVADLPQAQLLLYKVGRRGVQGGDLRVLSTWAAHVSMSSAPRLARNAW